MQSQATLPTEQASVMSMRLQGTVHTAASPTLSPQPEFWHYLSEAFPHSLPSHLIYTTLGFPCILNSPINSFPGRGEALQLPRVPSLPLSSQLLKSRILCDLL